MRISCLLLLILSLSCSDDQYQKLNSKRQEVKQTQSPESQDGFKVASAGLLEAEEANLTRIKVATNQPGFSGAGFADFLGDDSSVSWNVDYSAGTYQIKVRYGSGADRPSTLIINNSLRIDLSLAIQGQDNWAHWVTETTEEFDVDTPITVITIAADGKSSGPNLDGIEVLKIADAPDENAGISIPEGESITLQAEDAIAYEVTEKQDHPGYLGSGFMDFGDVGSYVNWEGISLRPGLYKLVFRYGGGKTRPSRLIVNGSENNGSVSGGNQYTLAFLADATPSWRDWITEEVTIDTKGESLNSLIVYADQSSGTNLDQVEIFALQTGTVNDDPSDGEDETPVSGLAEMLNLPSIMAAGDYANAANGGEGIENIFDSDPNTKWLDKQTRSHIRFDFPSPFILKEYQFTSANDAPARDPSSWKLLASNNPSDANSWVEISSESDVSFSERHQVKVFQVSGNTTAFKSYMFFDMRNSGATYIQLSDISLMAQLGSQTEASVPCNAPWGLRVSGDQSLCVYIDDGENSYFDTVLQPEDEPEEDDNNGMLGLPYIMAAGDNASASEGVDKIFDGNKDSKWLHKSTESHLRFDFPAAITLTEYHFTSANDEPGRDPKSWKLLASNTPDVSSSWVEISSESNVSFSSRGQTKTFQVDDSSTPYRAYMFFQIQNSGSSYTQLADIKFNEMDHGTLAESGSCSNPWSKVGRLCVYVDGAFFNTLDHIAPPLPIVNALESGFQCRDSLSTGERIMVGEYICSENRSYIFGIIGAPDANVRKKLALMYGSREIWSRDIHESSSMVLVEGKDLNVRRAFTLSESFTNNANLAWSSNTAVDASMVSLQVENGFAVLLNEQGDVVWTTDANRAGQANLQTGQTYDLPALADIPSKGSALRLASWNIYQSSVWREASGFSAEHTQTNFQKLGRVMRSLDADIWAFQETLYGNGQLNRADLSDLQDDLRDHVGITFNIASDLGGEGLFIATKPGIDILAHGKIDWYHKDGLARRNYAYILRKNGNKIVVLNTHFINAFDDQTEAAAKFVSAIVNGEFENNPLKLRYRESKNGSYRDSPSVTLPSDTTILVVGDFNRDRSRNEYRKVISSAPILKDTQFYVPVMTDLNPKKIGNNGRSNIDYILLKTDEYRVANTFLLDAKKLSNAILDRTGLTSNDTALKSGHGNDHLPHIVDLELLGN